jgi:invasion protein IalB
MDHRIVVAPARPVVRVLGSLVAAMLTTAVAGSGLLAQTPPPPPAQKKAAPPAKAQPKAPAAPSASQKPAEQAQQQEQPALIFSPWTKFCMKGQEPGAKQVCITAKDGRLESGFPMVGAALIEPEGEPKKVLRVTLPIGVSLIPGTRVVVDNGQPITAPYVICFTNGCMADYEASTELVANLKKGQGLAVQGFNAGGQPINLVVPLSEFAKAYDGPPTDPKEMEERQSKLQAELQRRAEEARKRLEAQPGQPR